MYSVGTVYFSLAVSIQKDKEKSTSEFFSVLDCSLQFWTVRNNNHTACAFWKQYVGFTRYLTFFTPDSGISFIKIIIKLKLLES
jgi:hypothetical protein